MNYKKREVVMTRMSTLMVAAIAWFAYLPASAFGTLIDTEIVWNDRTKVHDQEGGGVEITGTGTLIANARVDLNSPGFIIVRSGGVVQFNDQFKLPDDNEGPPGPTIQIEAGGLMEVADTESISDRLFEGGIFLAPDGIYKTGNISAGDRRDPRSGEWQIEPWAEMGATGIEISIDGDVATVRGIPEPATLPMICLGIWVLLVAPRVRR